MLSPEIRISKRFNSNKNQNRCVFLRGWQTRDGIMLPNCLPFQRYNDDDDTFYRNCYSEYLPFNIVIDIYSPSYMRSLQQPTKQTLNGGTQLHVKLTYRFSSIRALKSNWNVMSWVNGEWAIQVKNCIFIANFVLSSFFSFFVISSVQEETYIYGFLC